MASITVGGEAVYTAAQAIPMTFMNQTEIAEQFIRQCGDLASEEQGERLMGLVLASLYNDGGEVLKASLEDALKA